MVVTYMHCEWHALSPGYLVSVHHMPLLDARAGTDGWLRMPSSQKVP